ncbi:hypothetical protein LAWI1_G004185, partial [Lachnellula willkommii]
MRAFRRAAWPANLVSLLKSRAPLLYICKLRKHPALIITFSSIKAYIKPQVTMSQPNPEADSSFKPLTKAERIQQLNDIDKSITTLLHSAGLALKTLTDSSSSPSSRRTAFQSASESYLKTLQKADTSLKRQIWGLEEADIIPAEKAKGKEGKEGKDMFAMGGAR